MEIFKKKNKTKMIFIIIILIINRCSSINTVYAKIVIIKELKAINIDISVSEEIIE